ncbi:MAG: RNA 2',3'-cyclic phosphodiesterase [Candidatus Binatia bacterium]
MIRTFLAIHPSTEVLERIAAFQTELRDPGGSLRWLPPGSLHLTVHFLGDVRESELAGIERALAESLREQRPIDVECRGLGVFPNLRKPRVVWVGLRGEGLAEVAERAEIALSPLGFPPADREFRPHITVGRLRSAKAIDDLTAMLRSFGERSFGTSRIEHAILYKSDLRPTGSLYTPLATLPFLRV